MPAFSKHIMFYVGTRRKEATDMSKKCRNRLHNPALELAMRDHANLSFDFFDISVQSVILAWVLQPV